MQSTTSMDITKKCTIEQIAFVAVDVYKTIMADQAKAKILFDALTERSRKSKEMGFTMRSVVRSILFSELMGESTQYGHTYTSNVRVIVSVLIVRQFIKAMEAKGVELSAYENMGLSVESSKALKLAQNEISILFPNGLGEPSNQPTMNIEAYSQKPIARPVLILGKELEKMSDEDTIAAIETLRKTQEAIKALDINSKKMHRKSSEIEEAVALCIQHLDRHEG